MLAICFEYWNAIVGLITADLAANATERADLESQRAVFLDRLHRRSNDLEATQGLRSVSAALQQLPVRAPVVRESS
jgi:hypothetical protein